MGVLILSTFVAILSTIVCAATGGGMIPMIVTYFASGMISSAVLCGWIVLRYTLAAQRAPIPASTPPPPPVMSPFR